MKRITNTPFALFWAIILLISLSSCSHYYYVPNIQNVPLFREKNEFRGNIATGGELDLGSSNSSTEIQAAYSVTNHLALQSNFMSVEAYNSKNNRGKGKYMEGALGFYQPIKKHGVFEIYGGFGKCHQSHYYDSTYKMSKYQLSKSNLTFTKFFVQPSFGFTFKWCDVALSSRFCRVNFNNINYEALTSNGHLLSELGAIMDHRMFYAIEPAITVRAGWKYVKIQVQYIGTSYISNRYCISQETHLTLGLYISVANRFKK